MCNTALFLFLCLLDRFFRHSFWFRLTKTTYTRQNNWTYMSLSKGKCSFGEFDIVAITVIQNKLCVVVIFAHNFLVHIIVNTYEMIQSLCIECDVIWSLWLLDFVLRLPLSFSFSPSNTFTSTSVDWKVAVISLYNATNFIFPSVVDLSLYFRA